MDDIGKEHKCLGQQLKLWSDKWGVILENKGGSFPGNFKNFVVTSQYTIEDIFWEDKATMLALQRRFKIVHMTEPGRAFISKRIQPFPAAVGGFFKQQ